MKTEQEIVEWMKTYDVYKPFIINFCENNANIKKRVKPFKRGEKTFKAFVWKKSHEGSEYWKKVDKRFKEWYNE